MTKEVFDKLTPGTAIRWQTGLVSIVVDPRIFSHGKKRRDREEEVLYLQHLGGGCSTTLKRYEGAGFDWSKIEVLDSLAAEAAMQPVPPVAIPERGAQ